MRARAPAGPKGEKYGRRGWGGGGGPAPLAVENPRRASFAQTGAPLQQTGKRGQARRARARRLGPKWLRQLHFPINHVSEKGRSAWAPRSRRRATPTRAHTPTSRVPRERGWGASARKGGGGVCGAHPDVRV